LAPNDIVTIVLRWLRTRHVDCVHDAGSQTVSVENPSGWPRLGCPNQWWSLTWSCGGGGSRETQPK